MGVRGLVYVLMAVLIVSSGLMAGGAGQAEAFDKTYTPADWEPGGKLHDNSEPPQVLVNLGLAEEEPDTSLWLKQFLSGLLNLSFGIGYAVAQFAERHNWLPWVFIGQALGAGSVLWGLWVVAREFEIGKAGSVDRVVELLD
jgi:hypothetical protein